VALLEIAEPNPNLNEIEGDLFCPTCQYNLRGLKPAGLCPECATPIQDALVEVSLWNTDRNWVKAQRDGVALALAALATEGIHFFVSSAFFFLPIQWVAGALSVVGALRLTELNCDPRLKTPAPSARSLIRITALIEAVSLGLSLLGFGYVSLSIIPGFWLILKIGSFLGLEARAYYLIKLTRCFQEPGFQNRMTRGLIAGMVGLPGSVVLFYLALITGIGIFPFSGSNVGPGGLILLAAAGVTFLVSYIWYIAALIRLTARLNRVLNQR